MPFGLVWGKDLDYYKEKEQELRDAGEPVEDPPPGAFLSWLTGKN